MTQRTAAAVQRFNQRPRFVETPVFGSLFEAHVVSLPSLCRMVSLLRSLWAWLSTALVVVLGLPLMALVRLVDRDPAHYRTGRFFRHIGALVTRLNPGWQIDVGGERLDDPRRPYVVVANHQSAIDIPVVCRLPWEMKWVAKAELFRVPFIGWMMRMAGDIPVARGNKRSRADVLVLAEETLQRRCSVMFFPEGTRTRDGRVLRFSNGAFHLAIKQQVPVLPIAIDGTLDALPKKGWRFTAGHTIRLRVLPPIPTAGLTADDVDTLRERARRAIVEQLAAWRSVPPPAVDATTLAPKPTS